MMAFISAHMTEVLLGAGWAVSEIVGLIPGAKSSSVIQLIGNIGGAIFDALRKAVNPAA